MASKLRRSLFISASIRDFVVIAGCLYIVFIFSDLGSRIRGKIWEVKCPQLVDVNKEILNDALSRNLLIETAFGSGSGVNLGNGYFLTAMHVVINPLYDIFRKREINDVTIDGEEAQFSLVKDDSTLIDMVLLKDDKIAAMETKLNCYEGELEINTPIFTVGNPKEDIDVVTTGTIVASSSNYGPGGFVADTHVEGGSSGGGVYNAQTGQLIGITQRTDGKRMYAYRCTDFMPKK